MVQAEFKLPSPAILVDGGGFLGGPPNNRAFALPVPPIAMVIGSSK